MPTEWVVKISEMEKAGLSLTPILERYRRDRVALSIDLASKFGTDPITIALAAQAFYLDCVEPNPVNVVLHGR